MTSLLTTRTDLHSILRPRHPGDLYPTRPEDALAICRQVHHRFPDIPKRPHILDPGAGFGVFGRAARVYWPDAIITGVEMRNVTRDSFYAIDPESALLGDDLDPLLSVLDTRPLTYDQWADGKRHSRIPVAPSVLRTSRMDAYDRWITASFDDPLVEATAPRGGYDLILGNPPYSAAEHFLRRSATLGHRGSVIAFLLLLNFLASNGRNTGLFVELPIWEAWVMTKRPSFTGHFVCEDGRAVFTSDGKTDAREYMVLTFNLGYGSHAHGYHTRTLA